LWSVLLRPGGGRSDGAGGGEPARELVLTLFDRAADQDERLGAQDERLEKLERRLGHGFGVDIAGQLVVDRGDGASGGGRGRGGGAIPNAILSTGARVGRDVRGAQIVLPSAQAMTPAAISEVVFTDADTAPGVIHNLNRDGFDGLYPRLQGRPAADVDAAQAPRDQADRVG